MYSLIPTSDKKEKLAIGLMSGTSADGIDAVLVNISGKGVKTKVNTICFVSTPYQSDFQKHLLKIAKGDFGGSSQLSQLNFYLGEMFADACEMLCEKAGVKKGDIDFVGSHGHTVFHQPITENYYGKQVKSTLQIGEASAIAERLCCPVVSDFRVRDMAADGQGAPLVPYTEFILYASDTKNIALQNIGGIGNITYLPKNCSLSEVTAFDTGPGNMVIDAVYTKVTNGEHTYDKNGDFGASGTPNQQLLEHLLNDEYYKKPLPKTTGREKYSELYVDEIFKFAKAHEISDKDIVATVTNLTAQTIKIALVDIYKTLPDQLIVAGGGVYNKTLLNMIKDCLPKIDVLTQEDIGLLSDAKEAVAFALLANETLNGINNNAPAATGAKHPVVMGKISL